MSPLTPESTPAALVARAKAEQAAGDHIAAQTHALIAIAETLATVAAKVTPLQCPSQASDGSRCILDQGHTRVHWNGVGGWMGR
jgi:hypothetical protein